MVGAMVLIAILAVWYGASRSFRGGRADQSGLNEPKTQAKVVVLDPQNGSGEMGTASLTPVDGKTKVILKLTGAPKDVSQPAHIHTGTCATIGAVKYPLAFPKNGESETMLDIPLDSLLNELPLVVNVHKSPQEAGIYYSCGNITK